MKYDAMYVLCEITGMRFCYGWYEMIMDVLEYVYGMSLT